jgi:hypothetical protein
VKIGIQSVSLQLFDPNMPHSGPWDGAGPSNANVVEGKSSGNKNKNWKGKAK